MSASLRIGDRVQHVATGAIGRVFANPYHWRDMHRVGVNWSHAPGVYLVHDVTEVVLVGRASVPLEHRPRLVGAMAGGRSR